MGNVMDYENSDYNPAYERPRAFSGGRGEISTSLDDAILIKPVLVEETPSPVSKSLGRNISVRALSRADSSVTKQRYCNALMRSLEPYPEQ